jgi:hypothetical protein
MDGDNMMGLGFYKKEDDVLLYGEHSVENAEYTLLIENKDQYTYPVDGWYLFDSEEKAREFFDLPLIDTNNLKNKRNYL